ncbi:MAG: twin-arginine translocation signal domain-containing protein, partial [Bacteroidaceae bacterium]|nr:twin-arginine translocation signal domain-containing protein [Bacteroidaceae bacterium]
MPSLKRKKKFKTNNHKFNHPKTNISLMKDMSRRSFLKAGTAATAALARAPTDVLGKAKASKKPAQTGKIKLLGGGVGGR